MLAVRVTFGRQGLVTCKLVNLFEVPDSQVEVVKLKTLAAALEVLCCAYAAVVLHVKAVRLKIV